MYDLEKIVNEEEEDITIQQQVESIVELASTVEGRLLTEDEVRSIIYEVWVAGMDLYKAYLAAKLDDNKQEDCLRSIWGIEPFTGIRDC